MKPIYRRSRLLTIQYSKFMRFLALVCVLSLFLPMLERVALAVSDPGYQGTTISGRPSVAIVDAPGGTEVNTFLGSMLLPRQDLVIPGRGIPLHLILTYNSKGDYNGPFGNRWSFSFNMVAQLQTDNSILIQWGDGRRDLYQYTAGTYTPVNQGVFAKLTQGPSNTLLLTTNQGIQFSFNMPTLASATLLNTIQDPNGNTVSFSYNPKKQLTTITDVSGRTVLFTYNSQGFVSTVTDPNTSPARTFQYGYDSKGNQTSFTDALGNVTQYVYNDTNLLTQVTDGIGITDIVIDSAMVVVSISRSDLSQNLLSRRSFAYDKATKTTSVSDLLRNGATSVTTYHYDNADRLVKITDGLDRFETRSYDAAGNISDVTDPNGNTTHFTYDNRGNVVAIRDALGHISTFTYDPVFSKVASSTDPMGRTNRFTYTSTGQLQTFTDALGNTTRYFYDSFGQLVTRQNARQLSTTYTYDAFGNRVSATDPLGRTRSFKYDQVNNLMSETDANGKTTSYVSDAENNRIKSIFPDGSQATFTYDAFGNLLTVQDPFTDLAFTYDANTRVVKITDKRLNKTVSRQFNGLGNLTQATDPEGAITNYSYDLANRLSAISRQNQQFALTYDDGNRLMNIAFPNGSSSVYGYDNDDQIVSVVNQRSDHSVISSFAYQYDKAGNRTQLTLASGEQVNYGYDKRDQLISETRSGGSLAYDHEFSYDKVGNRTQLNADGVLTTYSYDKADELRQEITGSSTVTYQYDADGNRATKTAGGNVSSYSYDFQDRLVGFSSPTEAASYIYDALGHRTSKSVNGTTTQFVYDDHNAVAEYDGAGALQAQNLFGPGVDQNLARFVGSDTFYSALDALNSVRNVTDAAGSVQNSYDYDAWGNVLSSSENIPNNYTFTGREMDRETGLYYFRARTYDSAHGRFNQVDPADYGSARSTYVYADNAPVNLRDPSGESVVGALQEVGLSAAISEGVGTLVGGVVKVAVRPSGGLVLQIGGIRASAGPPPRKQVAGNNYICVGYTCPPQPPMPFLPPPTPGPPGPGPTPGPGPEEGNGANDSGGDEGNTGYNNAC